MVNRLASLLKNAILTVAVTLLVGMVWAWATPAEAAEHHDCPHSHVTAPQTAQNHHALSEHQPSSTPGKSANRCKSECCVSPLCAPAAMADGSGLLAFGQPLRHGRPASSLALALTIPGPPVEPPRV